jgi:hypothetical protein
MMNSQNAINEIHALVAKSEVNAEAAEKLLAISSWLEAELKEKEMEDFDWEENISNCNWR